MRWIISYEYTVHIRSKARPSPSIHPDQATVSIIDVHPIRFLYEQKQQFRAFQVAFSPDRADEITKVFFWEELPDGVLTESEIENFE